MAARKTNTIAEKTQLQVIPLFDNHQYLESKSILLAIEENLKTIDDNLQKLSFMNREITRVSKK